MIHFFALQVTVGEQLQDRVLVKTVPKKSTTPSLLGMQTMELSRRELAELNIKYGIRAGKVSANGAAADAGIRNGDIIVSFNKVDVESPRQLDQLVENSPRDHAVPVLVLRDRTPHFIALKVPKA